MRREAQLLVAAVKHDKLRVEERVAENLHGMPVVRLQRPKTCYLIIDKEKKKRNWVSH